MAARSSTCRQAPASRVCKAQDTDNATKFAVEGISEALVRKSRHSASRSLSWSRAHSEPTSSAARSRSPRRRCRNMPERPASSAPSAPTATASRSATRTRLPKLSRVRSISEKPPLHMPLGARALARTRIAEFTQDIDSWEGRRRRPTTSKSADRLESLRARKRVGVRSNVVSDAFCSVVRGGAAFRSCGELAKAEARGQWTPQ